MIFLLIYFIVFLLYAFLYSISDLSTAEVFLKAALWPIDVIYWLITGEDP